MKLLRLPGVSNDPKEIQKRINDLGWQPAKTAHLLFYLERNANKRFNYILAAPAGYAELFDQSLYLSTARWEGGKLRIFEDSLNLLVKNPHVRYLAYRPLKMDMKMYLKLSKK